MLFPEEWHDHYNTKNIDFVIKSAIATRRKEFFQDKVSKFNSKLSINVSKLSCDWLGDL